jgi:hypothetical protein
MHEEQKSGTPWNAQKTAREHKKKRGSWGTKRVLLRRWNLGGSGLGILARRCYQLQTPRWGSKASSRALHHVMQKKIRGQSGWMVNCFLLNALNSLHYTCCCVHAIFCVLFNTDMHQPLTSHTDNNCSSN